MAFLILNLDMICAVSTKVPGSSSVIAQGRDAVLPTTPSTQQDVIRVPFHWMCVCACILTSYQLQILMTNIAALWCRIWCQLSVSARMRCDKAKAREGSLDHKTQTSCGLYAYSFCKSKTSAIWITRLVANIVAWCCLVFLKKTKAFGHILRNVVQERPCAASDAVDHV